MSRRRRERSEFGRFLAELIAQAQMAQADFYTSAQIAKPYFYDMLTGTPPPGDTLEKMLRILEERLPPDEARRTTFFDLAAKGRQEIPADIQRLICQNPAQWNRIRAALTQLLAPANHNDRGNTYERTP